MYLYNTSTLFHVIFSWIIQQTGKSRIVHRPGFPGNKDHILSIETAFHGFIMTSRYKAFSFPPMTSWFSKNLDLLLKMLGKGSKHILPNGSLILMYHGSNVKKHNLKTKSQVKQQQIPNTPPFLQREFGFLAPAFFLPSIPEKKHQNATQHLGHHQIPTDQRDQTLVLSFLLVGMDGTSSFRWIDLWKFFWGKKRVGKFP